MSEKHDITQMLQKAEQGDAVATDELLPVIYNELRELASANLANEPPGQTLQATALVHEAWLRLVDVDYVQNWTCRRHFSGAAAESMRRILIDRARFRGRRKHGGDYRRITIPLDEISIEQNDNFLETLDEALRRFAQVDPVGCELVTLRYFAGLTHANAARTLGLTSRTADRLWSYAKAWLLRELQRNSSGD